jgi:3-dehydroquinate dehydratase-2
MNVAIVNGPNLNLLGVRQTDIYGELSFDDYFANLSADYPNVNLIYFQSNVEGELINFLHEKGFELDAIIFNAGGYTHTSVALADAISSIKSDVIEVHISNIYSREEFRRKSLIAPYCKGSICGFGLDSYRLGYSKSNSLTSYKHMIDCFVEQFC